MADPQASLCAAMAEAFAEFEGATKSKPNPAFRSKYADLSAVIDAVRPALVKHGLFFNQETDEHAGGVCVETVVRHGGGGELRLGKLFVPAAKQDAHGYGSALTYARRYSLMTAFGIPAEDDDGNAAAKSVANGNQRPQNGNGGKVDDHQWAHITQLMEAKGVSAQRFCERFQIASIKELPAAKYQDAVSALESVERKAA